MTREPTIFNEARLRAAMERGGIDLVIVRGNENSRYVSEFFHNGGNLGYRPFTAFYFRDPALKPALIVPAVDLHLAMTQSWIEDVRAYAMAEFFTDVDAHFYVDFFEAAKDVLKERGVSGMVVGTEGENLTSGFRQRLDALLDGNTIVDVSFTLEIVRMVKTPEEIRRLKRACDITILAHESFREAIRPGATGADLHRATCARMIEEGAHGVNFINIGCGPENSFAAHAPFPNDHVMQRGDFAKVDMGAMYLGYSADFVRSYFLGETTERHRDIWSWLNETQLELGHWMRPGMTGGEVFDRGYSLISRHLNKFPREFVGHGIGLGSHEQPRMNAVNRTVLEAGSVICLEYSYYHDGVRHHTEDTFLLKDDGVEHWTAACGRELVVSM
ncbi:M24 family metallopeptidase [Chelatococcus sp. GCM10030263]|uniref:M24 family metallopeptidase n=1 Tax=Chelatococcus sp. GCM10030263 TaxID=3273387 RepID=UPI00360ABF6B